MGGLWPSPPPTGASSTLWLSGIKRCCGTPEGEWNQEAWDEACTLGYHPLRHADAMDHTASGLDRVSVKHPWPGFPARPPNMLWCCVCAQRGRASRNAAPVRAPDNSAGQSLFLLTTPRWARLCGPSTCPAATITHGPRTQGTSDHSPLLGTKGDCKGKSIQSLFFWTWRTAEVRHI